MCLIKQPAMKTCGEVQLLEFLTVALGGGEWLACRFTLGENTLYV
jgi:hypothetical protein